jgi:hypothetical protein
MTHIVLRAVLTRQTYAEVITLIAPVTSRFPIESNPKKWKRPYPQWDNSNAA